MTTPTINTPIIITIITAGGISNLVTDDVVGYKNKKLIIIIK